MSEEQVIINIPAPEPIGLKVVSLQDNQYLITDNGGGWSKFSGTIEELFTHITKIIKSHNKHVEKFGGTKY